MVINCDDAKEILNSAIADPKDSTDNSILIAGEELQKNTSSFLLEKHLEDYIENSGKKPCLEKIIIFMKTVGSFVQTRDHWTCLPKQGQI